MKVKTAAGVGEDLIRDDMALVFDTQQDLVLVTGCGHAGVINIVEHARTVVRPARLHALIGGIHLFQAGDQVLTWTAEKLREFGTAHCTGVETVYRFRRDVGLDRAHGVGGAAGQVFELGKGIDPRTIAR